MSDASVTPDETPTNGGANTAAAGTQEPEAAAVPPPAPSQYATPAPPAGAPAAPSAPAPSAPAGGGETELAVDYPAQSSRVWAVLYLLFGIKALVMIVHGVILGVLGIGMFFVFVVAQAIVLFTGTMPQGMHRYQVGVLAQANKISAWVYGLTDTLPPFAPSTDSYTVETTVGRPASSSRLWALLNILWLKPLVALPHVIVLYVLAVASALVVFIAQIMVLVAGVFPRGMFDFVVGVMRWQTQVNAWALGLRDEYPRFSLE